MLALTLSNVSVIIKNTWVKHPFQSKKEIANIGGNVKNAMVVT